MQSYKRKITYFYQCHNQSVGATAGFLKLEIRGDKVKIIINIQESPGLPFQEASLYFYHEAGDHLAAIKVDQVQSINRVLTYQNKVDWQQLFDTGRDLYTFDGVIVAYNDNHYYIGDFQDRDRKNYPVVLKEKKLDRVVEAKMESPYRVKNRRTDSDMEMLKMEIGKIKDLIKDEEIEKKENQRIFEFIDREEDKEEPLSTTYKKENNIDDIKMKAPEIKTKVNENKEEDAFEKMLEEYPKLSIYGSTELFQCVRIIPKDIGKLDMRNWKLGVNSFLAHGYYTYQYLLLGKMRFDDSSEHQIIGVPGVYSNREKYLANMFGFEQFVPIKKTGVKTGMFGYWITEISPYL